MINIRSRLFCSRRSVPALYTGLTFLKYTPVISSNHFQSTRHRSEYTPRATHSSSSNAADSDADSGASSPKKNQAGTSNYAEALFREKHAFDAKDLDERLLRVAESAGSAHDRIPVPEDTFDMPRKFRHCDNKTIFTLAILGEHGARRERLVREIMRVDHCDWITARQKVEEINRKNDEGAFLAQLPYKLGVALGFTVFLFVPLVYHKETVLFCAHHVVHYPPEDIPRAADLDSPLLVGKFAWEWMEPIIGTMSFVLLGVQFMRQQAMYIGLQPYENFLIRWRARRLVKSYPQYDRNIVMDFSATDNWNR